MRELQRMRAAAKNSAPAGPQAAVQRKVAAPGKTGAAPARPGPAKNPAPAGPQAAVQRKVAAPAEPSIADSLMLELERLRASAPGSKTRAVPGPAPAPKNAPPPRKTAVPVPAPAELSIIESMTREMERLQNISKTRAAKTAAPPDSAAKRRSPAAETLMREMERPQSASKGRTAETGAAAAAAGEFNPAETLMRELERLRTVSRPGTAKAPGAAPPTAKTGRPPAPVFPVQPAAPRVEVTGRRPMPAMPDFSSFMGPILSAAGGATGSLAVPREHVLGVKDLRKRFGRKEVVRGVNFSMHNGEVAGLLGPNGAGKTTIFYMIVGFYRPSGGIVTMDDIDITAKPMYRRARQGIAYLPQEASIFRKLTVEQNIWAILESRRDIKKSVKKERLEGLLDEFGIDRIRGQYGFTLSGGERRRTEIARALATEPKFLLLDEPFAGIDPIAVYEIKQIIRRLAEKGIGILITDHNVRDTLEITTEAFIIADGTIVARGDREVILADEMVREVYLGSDFKM
jgi:lipopolysaccharide export system ATP-binding protein